MSNIKSASFKRVEDKLHDQLKGYVLNSFTHHEIPGINLNKTPWVEQWNLSNIRGLYNKFPYNCDLPKPLLPPARIPTSVLHNGDPALDIIYTKKYIQRDIDRIFKFYDCHPADHNVLYKKDIKWKEESNGIQTSLPRYISNLADHIEADPDPQFAGKYNWYYTGGSCNSIQFNGRNILLVPYMKQIVAVPIRSTEHSMWKPILKHAGKTDFQSSLYEIRHTVAPDSCRISARLKYECTFYSITETDSKLTMITVDSLTTKVPFISADLSPFDHNLYCTFDTGRLLQVCDMVSGKCYTKGVLSSTKYLDDNWGSVRYQPWDPDIVTVTDRCCLHHFDLRMPLETPVLSLCPKSKLEACESITLHLPSQRASRSYLGTYHSLLMLDDRSPDQCIQQKWTHQFKSPPLLGSTLMHAESEVIALSSQIVGETAIILNTWEHYDQPHSYNLPHTPPSILNTLKVSQQLGQCLDPLMTTRCELSNVGLQLLVNDCNDVFLFSQNSIGDVFHQCITHDKAHDRLLIINDHATYAMKMWENQMLEQRGIPEKTATPLTVTQENVSQSVANDCMNKSLKYTLGHEFDKSIVYRWQQSLEKLQTYVDILAPELLAVWEMSESNVPGSQAPPHQKVLNWLEMSSQKQSNESQEDPPLSQLLTPVDSQDLVSVSQQYNEVNIINEIPAESDYPPVKVRTKRKDTKKIKDSYVAGF